MTRGTRQALPEVLVCAAVPGLHHALLLLCIEVLEKGVLDDGDLSELAVSSVSAPEAAR